MRKLLYYDSRDFKANKRYWYVECEWCIFRANSLQGALELWADYRANYQECPKPLVVGRIG